MLASPKPFPWHQFSALSRADLDIERAAKRAVENYVDLRRLPEALNTLFLLEMSAAGIQRSRVTAERRHLGSLFSFTGRGMSIFLSLEPAMVAQLMRRVLGQPPRVDSGGPLGAATSGAAMALLTELARRLAVTEPLAPDFSLHRDGKSSPVAVGAQRAFAVDFWLRLDGVSYPGFASISVDAKLPQPPVALDERADVPILLPLVAAQCVLDAQDYASLCLGDVLIPEDTASREVLRAAALNETPPPGAKLMLCSPGAPRGLALLVKDGKLRLAGTIDSSYEAPVTSNGQNKPGLQDVKGSPDGAPAADVIMDAPVVVHLELGSISLSAQSWLGLKPGDVVCSELPVGRPVTLRVAGRIMAEGELVTVDGTVGVRIQRFFKDR